jgi:hypothetical protein
LARQPNITDLVRNGKCKYCGEQPVSGSVTGGVRGPGKVSLWCAQCGTDLEEFAARPENQLQIPEIDSSLDNDQFLAELTRIADQRTEREMRREKFMRMKIAQRRSRAK